jgi:hypothetical protein
MELVKHYTTLDEIGETLHNTWWNWLNITQHLMELVKHYTTLDEFGEHYTTFGGICETLHNTW